MVMAHVMKLGRYAGELVVGNQSPTTKRMALRIMAYCYCRQYPLTHTASVCHESAALLSNNRVAVGGSENQSLLTELADRFSRATVG